MDLGALPQRTAPAPPPAARSRAPLPIFGVASWTCFALGALGCELVCLWDSHESLELAGGVFMLPAVVIGLGGTFAVAEMSLLRGERPRGVAWGSRGLVILLVGGFALAMALSIVGGAIKDWISILR